jgi:hypothetical protein
MPAGPDRVDRLKVLTQLSTMRRKIGEDYSHKHSDWQSVGWASITF